MEFLSQLSQLIKMAGGNDYLLILRFHVTQTGKEASAELNTRNQNPFVGRQEVMVHEGFLTHMLALLFPGIQGCDLSQRLTEVQQAFDDDHQDITLQVRLGTTNMSLITNHAP